jgi:hypothetical protein
MSKHSILIISLLLLTSCHKHIDITNVCWNITEGYFNGKKIDFRSTDKLQLVDINGKVIPSLFFNKDGRISLPGINCPDICAKWKISDGFLVFTVDSLIYQYIITDEIDSLDKYFIITFFGQDSLNKLDSANKSEEEMREKLWEKTNPAKTVEFAEAMKIYGNPFQISCDGDNLKMESLTTKIIAIRDRTIDNLFKGL